jgi:hypothetical protein
MQVFPNPSSENFTVRFTTQSPKTSLALYNAVGQKVWCKVISAQGAVNIEIETEALAGGLYTLVLNDEANNVSQKLVLNK